MQQLTIFYCNFMKIKHFGRYVGALVIQCLEERVVSCFWAGHLQLDFPNL
jgi:hypothetical protein